MPPPITSTSNSSEASASTAAGRGSISEGPLLAEVGADLVDGGALGRELVRALGVPEVDEAEYALRVREPERGAARLRAQHRGCAPVAAEPARVRAQQHDERGD